MRVLAERRYERILEQLRDEGPAEVPVLADLLGVSRATVRRDLGHLEDAGLLRRLHGGATLGTAVEPPFEQVDDDHHDAKRAVAARAAGLVRDGEVVLLDIGTTTRQIAVALRGRPITVITSSFAVYDELVRDPAVELIVLGGLVRRNYRSMVGYLTTAALAQVHADRLFLGTSGVRRNGSVLDTTLVEVPVKQAMLAAADEVVLVADPAKFPGCGSARVCGRDQIDVLVTGERADAETLAGFEEAGVRLERVGCA